MGRNGARLFVLGGLGLGEAGTLLFILALILAVPFWTMSVAGGKGRNRFGWFLAGLFFNALALVAAYLAPPRVGTGKYVACPRCAEPILAAASRCKHCGSDIPAAAQG